MLCLARSMGGVMWNRLEFLVSTDEWAKAGPVDVDTDSPFLDIFWVVFIVLAVACAVASRMYQGEVLWMTTKSAFPALGAPNVAGLGARDTVQMN
jgi:hypothetical protein